MSLELTHRDHFKFVSHRDFWKVKYGKCHRTVGSFQEECMLAAKLIAKKTEMPLWILFSGGIDSEVVAQSFSIAGIPFRVAIMRFSDDINAHDIQWAVRSCERHGWTYKFFDLDIKKFWQVQLFDYAIPTKCISPQFAATMWLMDQINGYPILGSGECLLVRPHGQASQWALAEKEKVAAWYRFLQIRNRSGCPGFFQYTPELMLSALKDPLLLSWLNDPSHQQVSSSVIKHEMYAQQFALEKRPKYTGFENVMELDEIYRKQLKTILPNSDRIYLTPYSELIRRLSPSPWRTILNFS